MSARADWLAWRREGIGASDVAALMGLSPWASPWSVWADKTGLVPLDDDDEDMSDALMVGRMLEPALAAWFAQELGLTVAGEQTWCVHPEHETHRATVDGFVLESPDHTPAQALGVLEIKHEAYGRPWDTIPVHYQCQGQWALHVTGLERVWFAVLHGRRFRTYELERDEADIALMTTVVDRFWESFVVSGTPPPVDATEATARAIAQAYPGGGAGVDLPPGLVHAWHQAKGEAKLATQALAFCEAEIKAALGDAEEGLVGDAVVVTWHTQARKGSLCEEAMAAAGIDVEAYRAEPTTYRVLRLAGARKGTR